MLASIASRAGVSRLGPRRLRLSRAASKPGAITDRAGRKCARHVNVWIVARGINIGLNT